MVEFTPNDIILVGAGLAAALGGLIAAIQRSRCNRINCWGIQCEREVPPLKDEQKKDTSQPQTTPV